MLQLIFKGMVPMNVLNISLVIILKANDALILGFGLRIFRGYVARNKYKLLRKEVREELEDKQKAALDIQRLYRGHLARKRAIYERNPDPSAAEWARDYDNKLAEKEERRTAKAGEVAYT